MILKSGFTERRHILLFEMKLTCLMVRGCARQVVNHQMHAIRTDATDTTALPILTEFL